MREKKYDILLWDVDGTLLNFKESEKWALSEAFRAFGIAVDDEIIGTYSAINDSLWKKLELGEVTKEQVLRGRFEKLFSELLPGGELAHKELDEAALRAIEVPKFQQTYQTNLGSVYYYMEDSLSLCQKLKEAGFLQYIITNGVEWTQRNKLHLAGFDKIMNALFISEVIGFHKPDVRFFEGCFSRMNAMPEFQGEGPDSGRILVIGDSMSSDMKGAQNAGLDCCLYAPSGSAADKPDNVTYQIVSLWDVEELLWQNQKDKN